MNEQIFEEFKSNRAVIHCTTEEDAKAFMRALTDNDILWSAGCDNRETNWHFYRENTVYYCTYHNNLTYAYVDYALSDGKTVYTYEELMREGGEDNKFDMFDYLK